MRLMGYFFKGKKLDAILKFNLIRIEMQFVIFISNGTSKCISVRLGQCSIIVCYDMMF